MDERTEVTKVPEAAEAETINPNRQLWRDVLTGKGIGRDGQPKLRYVTDHLINFGKSILEAAAEKDQTKWQSWIQLYVKGGVPMQALMADLIAELIQRSQPAPSVGPTLEAKHTAIEREASLGEVFKRDCVSAGYNIFQLADVQMIRDVAGELRLSKPPVFWSGADSWKFTHSYLQRNISSLLSDSVEKRMCELHRMQLGGNVSEVDPRRYRVGNSIVVLADGKDNHAFLIIYGAISAEVAGSWKGGRTNYSNSVVFELETQEAVDKFLAAINTGAKAYDEGTAQNYRVIKETMSGVFPEEAMRFVESHMFHRQEIQEVVDLRENK